MNVANVLHKTSAGLLGVATLVIGADLVHAMTKEALVGKTPPNGAPTPEANKSTEQELPRQ